MVGARAFAAIAHLVVVARAVVVVAVAVAVAVGLSLAPGGGEEALLTLAAAAHAGRVVGVVLRQTVSDGSRAFTRLGGPSDAPRAPGLRAD